MSELLEFLKFAFYFVGSFGILMALPILAALWGGYEDKMSRISEAATDLLVRGEAIDPRMLEAAVTRQKDIFTVLTKTKPSNRLALEEKLKDQIYISGVLVKSDVANRAALEQKLKDPDSIGDVLRVARTFHDRAALEAKLYRAQSRFKFLHERMEITLIVSLIVFMVVAWIYGVS